MVLPIEEYRKKYKEVSKWLVFNPDEFTFDLKEDAPQEIIEMRQWLKDNYPAKGIELY